MKKSIGIHHITAIVGHPQENVDFYAGVFGLRLVKQTVNFDDPGTYHFYFGDEKGSPGTLITFFPWPDAYKGRIGSGQVGVISYAIPKGAMPFWENRLNALRLPFTKTNRFSDTYLQFKDVHGLPLELVERQEGKENQWAFGGVTPDVAIKGFAGATLFSAFPEKTAEMLKGLLGLEKVGENGELIRLKTEGTAQTIDIKRTASGPGKIGTGTVHHIAWRATDDAEQREWKQLLAKHGYAVTPVQDRKYFHSIYFQEPGKILFEIATDPPGFEVDERYDTLGTSLKLPPQFEPHRKNIEAVLPPFEVREIGIATENKK